VLATRATVEMFEGVRILLPQARYNEVARTITVSDEDLVAPEDNDKFILVLSAGTSDMPVAEEAVETATFMGNRVETLYDVGVAGLHRLLGNKKKIDEANVLIVVAGMDGALPSVVGGLVHKPVIAVPTSVGYGASFQGVGPLLTMLSSCAPGVTVVNIDNGFGAGYFASIINN
jgi:pyridinium-3,5-biscarboxylic acid mononucleotide synthase